MTLARFPLSYDPNTLQTVAEVAGIGFPVSSISSVSASRPLSADDNGRTLACCVDALVLTIPAGLPAGFTCHVISNGSTFVAPGGGVLLNNGSAKVHERRSSADLSFAISAVAANSFTVDRAEFDVVRFLLADYATYTSSRVATVNGQANVVDVGNWAGSLVVDVAALDRTSSDETYRFSLQGCSSSDFGSGVVDLATAVVTSPGRFLVSARTTVETTHYRYARLFATLAGTTPSINFVAYLL